MKAQPRYVETITLLLSLAFIFDGVVPVRGDQNKDDFSFTKVDLDLLEQCNLLDNRLEKDGVVYLDESLNSYVDRVGKSVLPKGAGPERVEWRFRVLRDPLANAFALPNGSIYVNIGLLALLENEAQLAAVLAHEAAHVLNRHSYLAFRSYRKKVLAMNISSSLVGAWSPFAGAAVGWSIYAIANVVPVMLAVSIYGYSRELEREADLYSVNRLSDSRYDAREVVNVFKLLQKDFEGDQIKLFYNDYPRLEERIAYANKVIESSAAKKDLSESPASDKRRYLGTVEKAVRHNVQLDIDSGRFHTALALSQKLVDFNPKASENLYYLAESYSALGPRAPELTKEELTEKAKKDARKKKQKLTLEEEESALMATAAGQANWKANQQKAQDLYFEAMELDSSNALAHRGLGMLFEKIQKREQAIREYRKYLELAPNAIDRLRIVSRLEALEKSH